MGVFQALIDQGRQSALENYAKNYANMKPEDRLSGLAQFAPDAYLKKVGEDIDTGNSAAAAAERAKIFGGSQSPQPMENDPQKQSQSAPLSIYADAISKKESGGNYQAIGPKTKSGTALGKYQVLDTNVGPWTKEALGQELTPDQFLSNPQAQEAVFKKKFGNYTQKYGPEGAARAWFAGEGGMNNPNAKDAFGTTVSNYAQSFNQNIGQQDQAAPQQAPLAAYSQMASAQPQTMNDATPLAQIGAPQLSTPATEAPPAPQQTAQNAPQSSKIQDYINQLNQSKLKENRELGRKLEEKYLQKQFDNEDAAPKIEMIEDASGVKKPFTYDKEKGSYTPAKIEGTQLDNSSDFSSIETARENGATKDDLLKLVPQDNGLRDYTIALLEGRAVPSNLARNSSLKARAVLTAHSVDPNFDEQLIPQRQAWAKSFGSSTPSSVGGQIQASGTVVKHLGDAYSYLDTIDSSTIGPSELAPSSNSTKMWLKGQMGDKEFNDAMGHYETAKKGIAGEMERLLSGSTGAEASKQYWMDRLDINQAPSKLKGALDEVRSLMMGRLSNIAEQKDRAFGGQTDPLSLLGKKEQEVANKITQGTFRKGQEQTPIDNSQAPSREELEAEMKRRGHL